MFRAFVALLLMAAAAPALAQDEIPSRDAPFQSYTFAFDRFAEETARMKDGPRVALFRKRFAALLPGFYTPHGSQDDKAYNARILSALKAYPALQTKYLATAQAFGAALVDGGTRFRRFFPDYERTVPVYLLHSLGEMDGGMRDLDGKPALIFGADMIARIHDPATVGPLLDHELFHSYHHAFFDDCAQLWCGLWTEGLATYVTARMNPGATDRQLLLTQPVNLRAAVDPKFVLAICLLKTRLDSTDPADHRAFFQMGGGGNGYPGRFGYYLGYRVAEEAGRGLSLSQLAHLDQQQARPRILRALRKLAPRCPRTEI